MHPGRGRDLSLNDAETFSNRRGLWMGPVDGRVPPRPMCSWEPPAGQIRGAGIWLQLWALGQGELGAGQGASRY